MSETPVLLGHDPVWAALETALQRDRLPHAILLTGPTGIGKSAFALRFAARLLCTGADPPCGDCARCRQVAAGSHPDVTRIGLLTGKKEIGIEQARTLKQVIRMRANPGSRKVAVVDDADRLSIAAQNALLKTLEEPPGDAVLLLTAASPGSLLPTVRSRCRRLALLPLADADMRTVLSAHGVPRESLAALVERAGGSPGRALAMRALWESADEGALEQLVAALQPSRYVPAVNLSRAMGKTEAEMRVRLESLWEYYRAASANAALAGEDATSALAAAEILRDGIEILRRRNPNRPLLGEALALRLARAGAGRLA